MSDPEVVITIKVPASTVDKGVRTSLLRDDGHQLRQTLAILNGQDATGNRRSTARDMRIEATIR